MSHTDGTPTQYHGPGGVTFTREDGTDITVSRNTAWEMIKRGTVDDDAWIDITVIRDANGIPRMAPKQDLKWPSTIDFPEPAEHVPGCASARTGHCTCTFLTQWDQDKTAREQMTGPELLLSQLDPDHRQPAPAEAQLALTKRQLALVTKQRDEYKTYWRDRALAAEKRLTILTWAGAACLAAGGALAAIGFTGGF